MRIHELLTTGPVAQGHEPTITLAVPSSICSALTNPIDYAVYLHASLALAERLSSWSAPANTLRELWKRMTAAGVQSAYGQPITFEDVLGAMRRLQNAELLHSGGRGGPR